MANEIHGLTIEIKSSGIQEATRQLKGLEDAGNSIQRTANATTEAFKRFGGVLSGGAVIAGISQMIRATANANDALAKLSARTGESVENLSRLQYAAELNDVTNEQLGNSLQRLAKAMSDTAAGSGESRAAFAAMGVSVTDAAGKLRSSGDVLRDIADKFSGYQDSASKAALAQRIFGESGAAMIPLLNQGRQGLAELADESDRFGRTVSTEAARAAEEFGDNLTRLNSIMVGVRNEIGNAVIPTLADLSREFLDARAAGLSFMEALVGIGLSDPTKGAADHIARLTGEIDKLRQAQAQPWYFRSLFENLGGEKRIAQLGKELDYWRRQLLAEPSLDPRDRMAGAGEPRNAAPTLQQSTIARLPRRTRLPAREDLNAGFDVTAAEAYATAVNSIANANLTAGRSTLDLNAAQTVLYDLMRSPEWERMPEPWKQVVIEQTASTTAAIDAAIAQKTLNALIAQTPTAQLEAQRATMIALAQAFDAGTISAEQFSEAATQFLGNDMPKLAENSAEAFTSLKSTIEGWGRDSADAIVQFALTGKASFTEMINSMLADMARMVIYKTITQPLMQAAGMAMFALMGFEKGAAFRSPSLSAYSNRVYDSPQFFAFAQGAGVFAEAGPEAIMPLSRDASGRLGVKAQGTGGNLSVEINNYSGAPVQQREVADGRGGRKMTIVIGEAVAGELRRPGSPAHSAVRQTFGLTPTLAGR